MVQWMKNCEDRALINRTQSYTWLFISIIPCSPTAGWEMYTRAFLGAHLLASLAYTVTNSKRPVLSK